MAIERSGRRISLLPVVATSVQMETATVPTSESPYSELHWSQQGAIEEHWPYTLSRKLINQLPGGANCNGVEAGAWQNATVHLLPVALDGMSRNALLRPLRRPDAPFRSPSIPLALRLAWRLLLVME